MWSWQMQGEGLPALSTKLVFWVSILFGRLTDWIFAQRLCVWPADDYFNSIFHMEVEYMQKI
jgi:hypothetical protein